jgi:hydrogenase nickel incorporation protein HypA/HybF
MHEVGIIESTLTVAQARARAAGATRIDAIHLRVGSLTGVVPEALDHAFTALRQGTLAHGARLVVEYVTAVCWCAACQSEFEAPGLFSECPACGTASGDIRRGRELDLISLEVE